MSFRDEEEDGCKFRVAEESSYAFNDVAEEDVEGFTGNNDLVTLKSRAC